MDYMKEYKVNAELFTIEGEIQSIEPYGNGLISHHHQQGGGLQAKPFIKSSLYNTKNQLIRMNRLIFHI